MARVSPEAVADFRGRLARAFSYLRRRGFVARQRVACCGSCARAELADLVGAAVFTTRQDDEDVASRASCHIAFGVAAGGAQVEVDALSLVAGRILADALRAEGLIVSWNGTIEERVFAALPSSPDAAPAPAECSCCSHYRGTIPGCAEAGACIGCVTCRGES